MYPITSESVEKAPKEYGPGYVQYIILFANVVLPLLIISFLLVLFYNKLKRKPNSKVSKIILITCVVLFLILYSYKLIGVDFFNFI